MRASLSAAVFMRILLSMALGVYTHHNDRPLHSLAHGIRTKQDMPIFMMLTVTLSLILHSTGKAESYTTYVAPNMTWTEAFTYCRQNNSGRLATTSTVEWKERGTPPDLPLNTWVWVGALFLESHTWKPLGGNGADLLEYVGCYEVPDISGTSQYKDVEGPPDCHRKCGRQHPGGHMYLKYTQCYCLPSSQVPSTHSRVESRKCDVICQKSFHWCGGDEHLYSVYALSRSLRINEDDSWEGPCFLGTFNKSKDKTWTLQIKNSSCDGNGTAFCVLQNKTVSLFAASSFQKVFHFCESLNGSLPLTFDSVSSESVDFTSYRNNVIGGRSVLDRSFWLNLNRSESPYWIDGKPFTEPDITRTSARCVAMRATSNVSVTFKVKPCCMSLPALCSGNEDHQEKESYVSGLVIIAGAAGAGVLVIVCLLTTLLAYYKRNGKRRSARNTSKNNNATLGEPQDSLHGQRSDASKKVCHGVSPWAADNSPNDGGGQQEDFGWFNPFGNHTNGQSKCLATFSEPYIPTDAAAQDARDDGCHLQEEADNIYSSVNSLTFTSSEESFSQDPPDLQSHNFGNAVYENSSSLFAESVLVVSPAEAASRDLKDYPYEQLNLEKKNRAKGPSSQLYLCLLFKT